jgi:hypothetical protein
MQVEWYGMGGQKNESELKKREEGGEVGQEGKKE